jgi:hypothetical protein
MGMSKVPNDSTTNKCSLPLSILTKETTMKNILLVVCAVFFLISCSPPVYVVRQSEEAQYQGDAHTYVYYPVYTNRYYPRDYYNPYSFRHYEGYGYYGERGRRTPHGECSDHYGKHGRTYQYHKHKR